MHDDSNSLQAFWIMVGGLSSFALGIVSSAILSRYFDKAEYGTYMQILYVYTTLLVIFTAGLPKVFAYYLPRFSLAQGKDIVWKISRVLFLAGLAFSIFLFLFSGLIAVALNNPELSIGLKYFSPIPMLLLPTLGIEGIFSTYKKTIFIAVYNTLTRVLMLLFIVMPVILLKGTYLYAIYGWLVVSLISLLMAYYFKKIPFKGIKAEKADLSYKEVFSYSLPLVIASLAGIATRSADHFYVSRFFGAEVFAEFSNGFIEIPFVSMVTGATSTVLMPIFSKLIYDKSDNAHICNLWRSALINSATLIYPIVIFFIYHADNLICFLYSSSYATSAIYFKIAMLINFFNIIIFAPLLFAMGETKFYSRLHIIFAFFAWTGGYLIILLLKYPVAIAAYSISLRIIMVLVCMKYVSVITNLKFFLLIPLKKISVLIIHSFIIAGCVKIFINHFFPQATTFFSLITNFGGFLILIMMTANIFNLDYFMALRPVFSKYIKKRGKKV